MASHAPTSYDPDFILEAVVSQIAQLIRSAGYLDWVGRREEAAKARIEAGNLAHLLDLLRTEVEAVPGVQAAIHRS